MTILHYSEVKQDFQHNNTGYNTCGDFPLLVRCIVRRCNLIAEREASSHQMIQYMQLKQLGWKGGILPASVTGQAAVLQCIKVACQCIQTRGQSNQPITSENIAALRTQTSNKTFFSLVF